MSETNFLFGDTMKRITLDQLCAMDIYLSGDEIKVKKEVKAIV